MSFLISKCDSALIRRIVRNLKIDIKLVYIIERLFDNFNLAINNYSKEINENKNKDSRNFLFKEKKKCYEEVLKRKVKFILLFYDNYEYGVSTNHKKKYFI